jgi:hypothetical protein
MPTTSGSGTTLVNIGRERRQVPRHHHRQADGLVNAIHVVKANACASMRTSSGTSRRALIRIGAASWWPGSAIQIPCVSVPAAPGAARTIAWLIRKPLGRVDDRADGDLRQLRPKRLMWSEAFARLGSSDHEGSKRTDHLEIECPQSVGNRTHPRGH